MRQIGWSVVAVAALGLAGLAVPASAATSDWTGSGVAITGTGASYPETGITGPITIGDNTIASPYPSTITVPAAHNSVITGVRVSVYGLTHAFNADIDMMLVGPHGQRVMLMSDVGANAITNVDLEFDDAAAGDVPGVPVTGSYRPTNNNSGTDTFPAPAPGTTTNTSLSVFNGTQAAGSWNLYVLDDASGQTGSIADWSLILDMSPTPYPSTVTVSGLTRVQDLNVTLTGLSHTYPDDLDVLLVGPQGQQATLLSDAGTSDDISGLTMTFDDQAAASPPDNDPITGGTWKPANYGSVTDPYPAPAPPSTGAAALSVFNGTDPNGVWRLYVVDDGNGDNGSLGSWRLTFTTDQAAPTGSVRINNGAATTVGTAVTLGLSAIDPAPSPSGVAQMRFSNDGVTWSAWQPYAATATWTLTSGAVGTRTVRAQFADAAGNISTVVSDTIQMVIPDTTSPTWTRFVPAKKAKNVPRTAVIKIWPSEALNPRTVSRTTVFVKRKGSTTRVPARVYFDQRKQLIIVKPAVALAQHKTYRVTVTPKVKDLAGNAFDGNTGRVGTQNLRWIFVTR